MISKEKKETTLSSINILIQENVYYIFIFLKYLLYALLSDIIFAALGLVSILLFSAPWLKVMGFLGLMLLVVSFFFKQEVALDILSERETVHDIGTHVMFIGYGLIVLTYIIYIVTGAYG